MLTPYIIREQDDLRDGLRAQDAGAAGVPRSLLRLQRRRTTTSRRRTTRARTGSSRTSGRRIARSTRSERLDELTRPRDVLETHEPRRAARAAVAAALDGGAAPATTPRRRARRRHAPSTPARAPPTINVDAARRATSRQHARSEHDAEQRFLGELLVAARRRPAERLEPLYAMQRERGVDLIDLLVNSSVVDEAAIARALADEAQLPFVDDDRSRARSRPRSRRACRSRFAKSAPDARRTPRTTQSVHVVLRRPVRHRAARRSARALRQARRGDRRARARRIVDAINRVYEREAGGGELETDDGAGRRRRSRERHPRLRRRSARHPLGQLALLPGDEGARERHPHRAGRERGHRPLPHRRRALRRARARRARS